MSALTLRLRLSGASISARGLAAASQFASLTQPDRYAAGASHPDGFRLSPQTQNPYGVTKTPHKCGYTKGATLEKPCTICEEKVSWSFEFSIRSPLVPALRLTTFGAYP